MPIEKTHTGSWRAETKDGLSRTFQTRAQARQWLKDPAEPMHKRGEDGVLRTLVKSPENPVPMWNPNEPQDIPMKPGKGGGLVVDMESDVIKTLRENFIKASHQHAEGLVRNAPARPTVEPTPGTLQIIPAEFDAGTYVRAKNTYTGRKITLRKKRGVYWTEGRKFALLGEAIGAFQNLMKQIRADVVEKVTI